MRRIIFHKFSKLIIWLITFAVIVCFTGLPATNAYAENNVLIDVQEEQDAVSETESENVVIQEDQVTITESDSSVDEILEDQAIGNVNNVDEGGAQEEQKIEQDSIIDNETAQSETQENQEENIEEPVSGVAIDNSSVDWGVIYETNPSFPEFDARAAFHDILEPEATITTDSESVEESISERPRRMLKTSVRPVTTTDAAGAIIHDAFINFQDNVQIIYRMPAGESFKWSIVYEFIDKALQQGGETAFEQEDYLRVMYKGWGASCSSSSSGEYTDYYVHLTFSYSSDAATESQLNTKLNEVLNTIGVEGCSDFEKIKGIYDYLTRNVTYDYENLHKDGYDRRQTAAGALLDNTAVCEGYASAFFRLCYEAGITHVRILTGIGGGEGHAWNIVALPENGSYLYYNMDVTWDAGAGTYRCFLKAEGDIDDYNAFDCDHIRNGDTRDRYYISGISINDRLLNSYSDEFRSTHPMSTEDYDYRSAGTSVNYADFSYSVAGDAASISAYTGSAAVLVIPETLPEIVDGTAVRDVPVRYIEARAFENNEMLTSVSMPSSLYSIGESAFFGCSSLTDIDLNEGLLDVGTQAFDYTSVTELRIPSSMLDFNGELIRSLVSYSMDEDGKYYRVRDGILYHYDGEWKLCSYPALKAGDNFVVPDGITAIQSYAFNRTQIKNLTVGNDVKTIELNAFYYCNKLENVVIGPGVSNMQTQAFMFSSSYPPTIISVELQQSQAPQMGSSSFNGSRVFYGINSDVVFHVVRNSTGWDNMPGTVIEDIGLGDLLKGYSLSISDEIYFNYYMDLTDIVDGYDNAYVEIVEASGTSDEKTTQISIDDAAGTEQINGETYHIFKYEVSAKNMADDITATVYASQDGQLLSSTSHEFSVEDYLEYIYNYYESNSNIAKLARTLLNYGGFAQIYFNYRTEHLANHSLYPYDVLAVSPDDLISSQYGSVNISTSVNSSSGREDPGIHYFGNSLLLKSKTNQRVYFSLVEGNVLESVYVDGTQVTPVTTGTLQYVTIDGISGANLSKTHTVEINSDYGSMSINISPMNYVYKVIVEGNSNEPLSNLMKAVYLYHQSAQAFLGANQN